PPCDPGAPPRRPRRADRCLLRGPARRWGTGAAAAAGVRPARIGPLHRQALSRVSGDVRRKRTQGLALLLEVATGRAAQRSCDRDDLRARLPDALAAVL